MSDICTSAEWKNLLEHHRELMGTTLVALFSNDADRANRYCLEAAGLTLDYAKNLMTETTWDLLFALAQARGIPQAIQNLFSGMIRNGSEMRGVGHHLMRAEPGYPGELNSRDVMPDVLATREKLLQIAGKLRKGEWLGATGEAITDVVNIGIGGSSLGPKMAYHACREVVCDMPRCHFHSNCDEASLQRLLSHLDPKRTLFIVSSKSFSTPETLANANVVKAWLGLDNQAPEQLASHFIAVTAMRERAIAFGIAPENILTLWDFVGGRFSLTSAISLILAIAIGETHYLDFLRGAREMDHHFAHSPLPSNMPVLLALISIWETNFCGATSQAIIGYDDGLSEFVNYCQQLHMESNGKSISQDGLPIDYATCPVIWGGVGTDVQHSFMQLLHQGRAQIPVDFILPCGHGKPNAQREALVANCLAQARALMIGNKTDKNPHANMHGNHSSNVLIFPELTPYILGALVALYEHKVFICGLIWHINSFDQWGVELGKRLAEDILLGIKDSVTSDFDTSTLRLIQYYKENR